MSFFKILWRIVKLSLIKKQSDPILLIGEYGKEGGTRTYLFYLLEFLYNRGCNVTLLLNNKEIDKEIAATIKKYNFKTLHTDFDFWCTDLNDIPKGHTKKGLIRYQIKELNFWCDIQNKNKFGSFIFSVGYPEQYLYSFLLPIKIIYILHSTPLKFADNYKRFILKKTLGNKKQILTVSDFAKKEILHYWMNKEQHEYVNFVYNYYKIPTTKKIVSHKTNTKTILTIGSLEPYKNPLFFITVAKKVIHMHGKDIRFVWAGDGSLDNTCKELTVNEPQISFVGHIENVEALYNQATIYYQPSLLDSHGISVLGAMYHSLPSIVSNKGGLKESVNKETGFVVSLENEDDSVEKINLLLEDENLRKELGAKAHDVYNLKFTKERWEYEMNKRLETYV